MGLLARVASPRLVARILERPDLPAIVQSIAPSVLRTLVDHVGLEDAGEIVSLATVEQLERLFDDDLWQERAGGVDEAFDPKRFALWLEVLLDAGERRAIEKIAHMDEDFLAFALTHHVLVVDIEALAAAMSGEPTEESHRLEKALEGCLCEELEEFRVIAREGASWDAILTLLVALDQDHHPLVRRLLERCCAATSRLADDEGGLYEVLTEAESLASDVAFDREERREREGFVAPTAAASFLRLAKTQSLAEILSTPDLDPVTRAHFRSVPEAPPIAPTSADVEAFLRELRAMGVVDRVSTSRRLRTSEGNARDHFFLRSALAALGESDAEAFASAHRDLAYLVNVVISVCGGDRRLGPLEALEIVSDFCELGFDHGKRAASSRASDAHFLRDFGAIRAFRVGWNLEGAEPFDAERVRAAASRARRCARVARKRRT